MLYMICAAIYVYVRIGHVLLCVCSREPNLQRYGGSGGITTAAQSYCPKRSNSRYGNASSIRPDLLVGYCSHKSSQCRCIASKRLSNEDVGCRQRIISGLVENLYDALIN
jgi:hypothetical protein